jgi:mRNA interferase MazF
MNQVLRTVIIAPMTTTKKVWPSRVAVKFGPVESYVALDQMRSVDKARLLRRRGALRKPDAQKVCDKLVEIFTL